MSKPKKTSKKHTKADWRKFEELVARIEKALAPMGAIVKSPDSIKDLFTGRSREVDTSIRYTIGTIPILITVECRKRNRVEDVVWIEQLIAKKQNIGASRTVAVSSKGFTDSAIESAKKFGIELRTVSDMSAEEVGQWHTLREMLHVCTERCIIHTCFIVKGAVKPGTTLAADLQKRIDREGVFTKIIERDGKGISGPDLVEYWQNHFVNTVHDLDYGVTFDGVPATRQVSIETDNADWVVHTNHGNLNVTQILITLTFTKSTYQSLICRRFKYADSDATLVEVVEYGSPNEMIPAMSLYQDGSGEIKIDYKPFEPGHT